MRYFLIFLLTITLWATDTNSSTKYEKLLSELKDENNSIEYIKLQKSLVYKLINITKFYKPKVYKSTKITKIQTQEDFIKLINKIISYKYQLNLKKEELKDIEDKLSLIEENIQKIDKNSPHLLTFQLQKDFYTITKKQLSSNIKILEDTILKEVRIFNIAYERVTLDYLKSMKRIKELKREYQKITHSIFENSVEQDRLFILKGSKNDKIVKTLEELKNKKDKIIKDIIIENLIIELYYLKLKSDEAFKYQKKIEEWIEKLSNHKNIKLAKESIKDIISPVVKKELGTTKVITQETKSSLTDIAKLVWEILNKRLFSINKRPISTISIIIALIIMLIGFTIAKSFKTAIQNLKGKYISNSSKTLIANIGYYLILLISFSILLKTLGLDLSSLALIAGALSVGIGFGLQNLISNLVSGIILMFEKSIKIGDFIQINEELTGRVIDIKIRSTTIVTNDNIEIIVPNQMFIENNVINWTYSNSIRRFRIPFGVAYGTDISKVKKVILKALSDSNIEYIRSTLPHRKPLVVMMGMNSSSVDFELFVWIEGEKALTPRRTASEFLILIYNALYENNIEIPFPQLDLHLKSIKE